MSFIHLEEVDVGEEDVGVAPVAVELLVDLQLQRAREGEARLEVEALTLRAAQRDEELPERSVAHAAAACAKRQAWAGVVSCGVDDRRTGRARGMCSGRIGGSGATAVIV